MKISEREEQILLLLKERSFISVQELSSLLYTSPSSVRRDLSRLEKLGIVKRNYGGVVAVGGTLTASPVAIRSETNKGAKRAAARKAARLLFDGATVLLDDSTSAAAMLEFIAEHSDVSVFTNNVETAAEATERGIRTYLLGGALPGNSATVTVGKFALDMLRAIRVDLCFFSATALSEDGEVYDSTEEHNLIRREMLTRAEKQILLCDGSKIGRRALYRVTSLQEISAIASDVEIPESIPRGNALIL